MSKQKRYHNNNNGKKPSDGVSCKTDSNGKRRKFSSSSNYKRNNGTYKDEGYYTGLEAPNVIVKGKSVDNDPKWYMNLDNIAKDYATLPFSTVLGLPDGNVFRDTSDVVSSSGMMSSAPGIMSIYFIPTIGTNESGATAAINIAAQQIYTLIRKANSGAVNYDRTDVMMLIMAMDSAYMLYEDLLRAYRTLSSYSGVNRYYPLTILNALGYDISLQYNLADFRGILDMFAYKLASVNIPDQMDIIKRHSWMCSNIYLDDDNNKAQSYAFVPTHIYKWTEGTSSAPTSLQLYQLHREDGTNLMDIDDITNAIDDIMNPILGSQDIGTITGDMAKAFGEQGMIKIRPVEDYAALVPVYSQEVLLQIRNTFCSTGPLYGTPSTIGSIVQVLSDTVKGPYLSQTITINSGTDGSKRIHLKPLLNFINEDTSPENVMVATRLICIQNPVASGGLSVLKYYGTEVVTSMRIYGYEYHGPALSEASYAIDQDILINTGAATNGSNASRLVWNAAFNNAPVNYIFTKNGADYIFLTGTTANLCNYVHLDDDTIRNIHEVAVTSLFTVKDYPIMR